MLCRQCHGARSQDGRSIISVTLSFDLCHARPKGLELPLFAAEATFASSLSALSSITAAALTLFTAIVTTVSTITGTSSIDRGLTLVELVLLLGQLLRRLLGTLGQGLGGRGRFCKSTLSGCR